MMCSFAQKEFTKKSTPEATKTSAKKATQNSYQRIYQISEVVMKIKHNWILVSFLDRILGQVLKTIL